LNRIVAISAWPAMFLKSCTRSRSWRPSLWLIRGLGTFQSQEARRFRNPCADSGAPLNPLDAATPANRWPARCLHYLFTTIESDIWRELNHFLGSR
jgi:hypothetical protein